MSSYSWVGAYCFFLSRSISEKPCRVKRETTCDNIKTYRVTSTITSTILATPPARMLMSEEDGKWHLKVSIGRYSNLYSHLHLEILCKLLVHAVSSARTRISVRLLDFIRKWESREKKQMFQFLTSLIRIVADQQTELAVPKEFIHILALASTKCWIDREDWQRWWVCTGANRSFVLQIFNRERQREKRMRSRKENKSSDESGVVRISNKIH